MLLPTTVFIDQIVASILSKNIEYIYNFLYARPFLGNVIKFIKLRNSLVQLTKSVSDVVQKSLIIKIVMASFIPFVVRSKLFVTVYRFYSRLISAGKAGPLMGLYSKGKSLASPTNNGLG